MGLSEIDQVKRQLAEVEATVSILKQKMDAGNGWIEYRRLVLTNIEEVKDGLKEVVDQTNNFKNSAEELANLKSKIEILTETIDDHKDSTVKKEEFESVKKLINGDGNQPGLQDLLRVYRQQKNVFYGVLSGSILVIVTWLVSLFTGSSE